MDRERKPGSAPERTQLSRRAIWAMPILLTVTSSVALVIGLVADGAADVAASVGLGVPVLVAAWHVVRATRSARACRD